MKKVYVKLEGYGPVYWFDCLTDPENHDRVPVDDCDYSTLEEDGWIEGSTYEVAVILEDVKVSVCESIYDEDDCEVEGEDITKKKGKYVLTNNYFSDILGYKTPFYFHQTNDCYIEEYYQIDLEDDEEFDPKKLQLIKSDYELSYLPYAIVTTHIMYDGKMYGRHLLSGYNISCEIRSIYDEEQPYASSNRAISLSRDMIVEQEEEEEF